MPHLPMRKYAQMVEQQAFAYGLWVRAPLSAPLIEMYLQQKATHLLGGFLRSLGGRRGSDFCEFLTFRENFSQKIFLKKFSNFPENRLTTARKCGIIEENQGG